jgi:hypothetical protein
MVRTAEEVASMSQPWDPQGDAALPRRTVNQAFSVDVVFRLGWAAVQREPGLAAVAGVSLVMVLFGPSVLQQVLSLGAGDDPMAGMALGGAGMVVSLLAALYTPIVTAGVLVAFARVLAGGEASPGTVLWSGQPGLNTLLAQLALGIGLLLASVPILGPGVVAAVYAGYLLVFDPSSDALGIAGALGAVWLLLSVPVWIYVTIFAPLVPVIAALEPVSPIEAVREAWSRAHGSRITLFVLQLALSVATGVACCFGFVGLIPLYAVYYAGLAAAWMTIARSPEELRKLPFFQENAADLI